MPEDTGRPTPRSTASENIAARIQSLRSILSSEQHTTNEQRVALEAIDREEADRRLLMERDVAATPSFLSRAYTDEGYWDRPGVSAVRERRQAQSAQTSRPATRIGIQQARMTRLARSEHIENYHPQTSRPSSSHPARTRQASTDLDHDPRSARQGRPSKRRKLDDGTADDHDDIPDYTEHGTLLPCNLKMNIISSRHCDKTSALADAPDLHIIENKDVFRSGLDLCSILMKHQGGWPFDLSKLIVKTPKDDDDTAPLQGMVFVAMNTDDLLEDSRSYNDLLIEHHTLCRTRRSPRSSWPSGSRAAYRAFQRSKPLSDPGIVHWRDPDGDARCDIDVTPGFDVNVKYIHEDDEETAMTPPSPRSPQPWLHPDRRFSRTRISARDNDYYPPYTTAGRSRRRQATTALATDPESPAHDMSPTPSDSEDEEAPLYGGVSAGHQQLEEAEDRQQSYIDHTRLQRIRGYDQQSFPPEYRAAPPRYDNYDTVARNDPRLQSILAAARGPADPTFDHVATKRLPGCTEMLQGRSATADSRKREPLPHAKFEIAREGGAISIDFDPPVSGKYILIKVWSQCPDEAITLQCIAPFGFAGLKQSPDVSFR